MNEKIYFYSTRDEHGYMSNFSRHSVTIAGRKYATTEHYFQAQKAIGTKYESKIASASSPKEAASLGRSNLFTLRKDWDHIRDNIMRIAVETKFRQNLDIKEKLLNTGNAKLIENSPVDYYWGCGKDGSGKNRLGFILMEVRDKLRKEQETVK